VSRPATVRLHLLRHAHAGDPLRWHGPDDARPLSERGRRQAERLGRLLAEAGFAPDLILSSPRVRALETARLVAEPLRVPVRVADALAGMLDAAAVESLLADCGDPERPLLVGHDPDFSDLAAQLTGLPELPMRKGALVRIDLARPIAPGEGVLRWLLPPDLLGGDDRGD
jgi:phosphohistidine phosphatase